MTHSSSFPLYHGGLWPGWDTFTKLSKDASKPIDIIIPALNEEQSIGLVLEDVPKGLIRQIIVVDNGSEDRTAEVAKAHGAHVILEPQRGYGAACLAGLRELANDPPFAVVFLDADYSDYPDEIPQLLAPLFQDGVAMVIGSRMIGEREQGALLPQALFGNWLAGKLLWSLYHYRFTDLGPFRAIRWSALEQIQMEDEDFGWTVEMQIKAAKLKLSCVEVPVKYRARIGVSKITGTIQGTMRASAKILYTLFRYAL